MAFNLDRTIRNIIEFPWDVFKSNMAKYLNELEFNSLYPISVHASPTLISSAIALLLQYSLGIDINKKTFTMILNSWDIESKSYKCNELESQNTKNKNYLRAQTNYFCRVICRTLYKSENNYERLERKNIEMWMQNIDWNKPWDSANEIMFVLDSLFNPPTCENNIKIGNDVLKFLQSNINKDTGFWGSSKSSKLSQMCGSMHIYPFIIENNLNLNNNKIVSSTLDILSYGGCFYPIIGGGACPDYDGTCLLTWFKLSKDQNKLLLPIFTNHLMNQENGLFIEARRFINHKPKDVLIAKEISNWIFSDYHYYSGWESMKYHVAEPNLWACWVRTLSIAMIQHKFGVKNDIKFLDYPGLGWVKDNVKK
jgi:hypothetical protein